MPLKQKLTATEYAALASDAERSNYKLVGADYVPDVEGVDNLPALVNAYGTVKGEKETLTTQLKQFEGVDPVKYREYVAADQKAGIAKIVDKGQYDQALETVTAQKDGTISELQQKLNAQAVDFALTTGFATAGVIPERMKDALQIARPLVGVNADGSPGVLGKDGKVDLTIKFDDWLKNDFKKERAYLYQPNGNGGSGAQNGTNTATGDKPTKTRAEANTLPPAEKMAFMEQVSQGKAVLVDN